MEQNHFFKRETDVKQFDKPPETILPARPGYNSQGKAISIRVNQFKVLDAPNKDVYQYNVSIEIFTWLNFQILTNIKVMIGEGAEKMGLIKKVWESKTVKRELAKHGKFWLWDGNQIAW